MSNFIKNHLNEIKKLNFANPELELRTLLNHSSLNNQESHIMKIYNKHRKSNVHKMNKIPVFKK